VLARAILGEWIREGSGGGCRTPAVWPGMKLIVGSLAREGDPEFGISAGDGFLQPTRSSTDRCARFGPPALQARPGLVHGEWRRMSAHPLRW